MFHSINFNFFIPIYIVIFIVSSSTFSHGKMLDGAVLNVGEELKAETLPLKLGSRVYKLQGLKSLTWYEVKISYPASIPASFSLQLKKGDLESGLNRNRRLLNTEKLIFKTDNLDSINDQVLAYAGRIARVGDCGARRFCGNTQHKGKRVHHLQYSLR
ncbi:hypothetical protein E1A91_D07G025600v1 [Gossypium mustelinum]|uniref:Uncharacterized protein isoform X2 n=3 Tax=Gossypium TaxID=3633 RepID=A0A1U8P107_GOSHI|nr:uncharacterized protein LOC107953866 isoform X2 [Gossypium hirsutum]TYI71955.1 hypothetical protein E1A91_D07G025600v1 [Gossypium mustelinum]